MPTDSACNRPHAPRGLVRALGRLDTVVFVITAVVVLDTVGAVAVGGPEAFTWLVVMGALFLVPSALLTAELGAAFPAEGGHYVWTRLAFGRVAGAVSALLYWIETPIWIGGSLAITAIAVTEEFVAPLGHAGRLVFAFGFVWAAVGATVLPIRLGRFVPASGAVARVVLIALFSVTVCIYAVVHGVHGFAVGHLQPTGAGFAALVPVLLYNYLGFDVPVGRRRRDARSAARPPGRDPARRRVDVRAVRRARARDAARAAARADHRPDRVRGGDPRGVHRLRPRRRRARHASPGRCSPGRCSRAARPG